MESSGDSPHGTHPSQRGREGPPPPPHHYGNSVEDVNSHFHGSMRRHPPPHSSMGPPPQQLTFHNSRVAEMALAHTRKERLSAVARRRGGYPTAGTERQGLDDYESGVAEHSSIRDPRLNRKAVQQITPSIVASKKQDIHSLVHQILSEHSYSKGRREGEGFEEDEWEGEEKGKMSNGVEDFRNSRPPPSSYLTVVTATRTRPMKRQRLGSDGIRRSKAFRRESDVLSVVSRVSSLINPSISCSKHLEAVSLYCNTCGEVICQKCVEEDAPHSRHTYYQLVMPNREAESKERGERVVSKVPEAERLAEPVSPAAQTKATEVQGEMNRTGPGPKSEQALPDEAADLEDKEESLSLRNHFPSVLSEEDDKDDSTALDREEEMLPRISVTGFELDLDTEPSSSEDEPLTDDEETYKVSFPSNLWFSEPRGLPEPEHLTRGGFGEEDSPQHKNRIFRRGQGESDEEWSITNLGTGKMRLSRSGGVSFYAQQVLSTKLALYASNSSPSSRADSDDSSPMRTRSSDTPVSEGEGELDTPTDSLEGGAPSSSSSSSLEALPRGMRGRGSSTRRRRRGAGWSNTNTKYKNPRLQRVTRNSSRMNDSEMENSDSEKTNQPRTRSSFKGFQPEILTTRSRGESATMRRRMEMEKEMEQHERERIQTARPEDLDLAPPSPPGTVLEGSILDDLSSEAMSTHSYTTTSSLQSCKDVDTGSVRSSLLEEFSPDVIARCKKISTARNSGDTPLHKVCRTGKYEMARYLIMVEHASVNAQDNAGWTPLHEACCHRSTDLADLLLKAGADANVSATDGTRPIHDAIESGNLELVKLLLSYSADPMAEIGEKTPLEFADAKDQVEIHAYLQSVVQETQRQHQQHPNPTSTPSPAIPKKPTRASKKDELLRTSGEQEVAIPVDGYGPDGPYCGEELDYPLFYVTPIIELSDCPFLPVYNFKLVSNSSNPRRHNFHLISDILDTLVYSEEELLDYCDQVQPMEFTVGEVLEQMGPSCHKIPDSIMDQPHNKKLRFLPLCSQLRQLLDIQVENLDD